MYGENKKDFFISYNKADKQWAKWIAGTLEENNYTTIIQAWDFRPGDDFILAMHESIKNTERFIAVISAEYLNSIYCTPEWTTAINIALHDKTRSFIPVRVTNVETDGMLLNRVYIDFVGKDEVTATKILLHGVDDNDIPREKPSFPNSNASKKVNFPNALPDNNLIYNRNIFFTGRIAILENIHSQFQTIQNISLKQTIDGLGGVGKTQIALEYAYRYAHEYNYIWWIRAETEAELIEDIRNFVVRNCGLPKDAVEDEMRRTLFDWLNNNDKWLFIYDNVEDFNLIKKWIPINSYGHILITTRDVSNILGKSISVDVFDEQESVNFLYERTKIPDVEAAKLLSMRLGYLPLALEQAAAYIVETPSMNCNKYLDLLERYGLKIFDKSKPIDYSQTVKTTWQISLQKIESESAKLFLEMCSFLASDNIPIDLFMQGCDELPVALKTNISDDIERLEMVKILTRYALLKTRDGTYFSMHRLLQEVIRMDSNLITECVNMLQSVFEYEYGNNDLMKAFTCNVPHVLATIEFASNKFSKDTDMLIKIADLYHIAGYGFEFSGQPSQALEYYLKSLDIKKKALGTSKHPSIAKIYNSIARVHENEYQDNYQSALNWHNRALSIRERILGKKHPDTADSYTGIADIYNAQGKYEDALALHLRVLEIRKKVLKQDKQKLATCYYNIAKVYIRQENCDEGLAYSLDALAIDTELFGTENSIVAIDYTNIAKVYSKQGDFDNSLEEYLKAYRIFLSASGEDHYNTVITRDSMKDVYGRTDNFEPFEEWLTKQLLL